MCHQKETGCKRWLTRGRTWEEDLQGSKARLDNMFNELLKTELKHRSLRAPNTGKFKYKQSLLSMDLQFSSVAQSCPTLGNPMNHSMPGLPVHRQLPEFTQTHVHRVSDAIQPSHPLSSPSLPAPNTSQHQSLGSSAGAYKKVWPKMRDQKKPISLCRWSRLGVKKWPLIGKWFKPLLRYFSLKEWKHGATEERVSNPVTPRTQVKTNWTMGKQKKNFHPIEKRQKMVLGSQSYSRVIRGLLKWARCSYHWESPIPETQWSRANKK